MTHPRPSAARARLGAKLALVAAVVAIAAAGCSSDSSGPSDTGSASAASAKAAVVKDANAVCKAGKARTAKIVPGVLVVPKPSNAKEKAATKAWADATAVAIDKTADELEAVKASGDDADQLSKLVDTYRAAADTLRSKGGAVLGDQNFLSDQPLFDYGFTVCVAPVKAAVTTSVPKSTKKTTTTKP